MTSDAPAQASVEAVIDGLDDLARRMPVSADMMLISEAIGLLQSLTASRTSPPSTVGAEDEAPAQAPSGSGVREADLNDALDAVEHLNEGDFYADYDRAVRHVGALRRVLASLASDASPRGEAVAELNAVESAMLEIAQSEGPRGFVLLSPDQARDLIINAQAFCEGRGIKVAAHPAPATVESFPRLTDEMIRAACKAHYGSEEVDGIAMTVRGQDWNFRQAFKRMWKGARRAALAPATEGRKG